MWKGDDFGNRPYWCMIRLGSVFILDDLREALQLFARLSKQILRLFYEMAFVFAFFEGARAYASKAALKWLSLPTCFAGLLVFVRTFGCPTRLWTQVDILNKLAMTWTPFVQQRPRSHFCDNHHISTIACVNHCELSTTLGDPGAADSWVRRKSERKFTRMKKLPFWLPHDSTIYPWVPEDS